MTSDDLATSATGDPGTEDGSIPEVTCDFCDGSRPTFGLIANPQSKSRRVLICWSCVQACCELMVLKTRAMKGRTIQSLAEMTLLSEFNGERPINPESQTSGGVASTK